MPELMAADDHRCELVERFVAGVREGGVSPSLVEAIGMAAPPARDLAPHLRELVGELDEPGRFAVAALAVALAGDPGYRPVVETVVIDHPLGATHRPWLIMRGARLDGPALRWWLELVAERMPVGPIDYALHRRREIVLAHDREIVAMHLLRTDTGPARHAAELAVEVLCRGGPCPPVEAMFSRWIHEGRFDGDVADAHDDSTSAPVLARCLERGLVDGPFTERWALARDAVEHWRELLSSGRPQQRRRGLLCLTTLLTARISVGGLLPWALADREVRCRPEWGVIERGFSAVNAVRRRPRQAAEQEAVLGRAVGELEALARPDGRRSW